MGKTHGNKEIKEELIRIYGDGCMFDRARIAERIEQIGGIRTFKSFKSEKRFKGQKLKYRLTVHHLKHRSEGGTTTVENTALISELAHQYTHSLPRNQEEYINEMLREFKINCIQMTGDGTVLDSQSITFSPQAEIISIPVFDNTLEDMIARREYNQRQKYKKLNNPSRAAKKRQMQREIDDWEYGDE